MRSSAFSRQQIISIKPKEVKELSEEKITLMDGAGRPVRVDQPLLLRGAFDS